jgi:hypothetical protein
MDPGAILNQQKWEMRWKDMACRLDGAQGGGLVLAKVNKQARRLIGYREGRCERTGT